jgi:glycine/D-amino acid oxidase-like deaminating enzyme
MDKNSKIVIVGAGVFGLSTAAKLASEGYQHAFVLDRHTPPVRSLLLRGMPRLTGLGSGWIQLGHLPSYPLRLCR